MNIENLLNNEIESEFAELENMELGTETYQKTVDGIIKMVDRSIELKKFNIENDNKVEAQERENDIKMQQMEDERKDRKIKNYITIASIAVPVVVTVWGTLKTFKFEEEGTITSIVGRGFINKLIKK